MSRLHRKLQTEIALLLVRLKSDPALADKVAQLQAELTRLEMGRKNLVSDYPEMTQLSK